MRIRAGLLGLAMVVGLAGSAAAQESNAEVQKRLAAPVQLLTATQPLPRPAVAEKKAADAAQPAQPVMPARGSSVGMMVAGGALFVAGAIIGGGAGTLLMVGGAAVGAYGLYLYFG